MPSHSRTTSSYGYRHRKIRAQLLPAAIGTYCPGDTVNGQPYRSPRCIGLMTNPATMHLAHETARILGGTDASFINCAPCNLGAGATLGNQLRDPTPTVRHPSSYRIAETHTPPGGTPPTPNDVHDPARSLFCATDGGTFPGDGP